MRWLVVVSYLLLATSPVHCGAAWVISGLTLKPTGGLTRTLTFEARKSGGPVVTIATEVRFDKINDAFVAGDNFAILGGAPEAQDVVVFSLTDGRKIDSFVCYGPQRISENWIASIEYYPRFTPGFTPTDVVLIYDLAKTPLENRLDRRGGLHLPPGTFDNPIRVGIPVFPERNAQERSYVNLVSSDAEADRILGQPFFLLLSGKRLLFLSNVGHDATDFRTHLIMVDLSGGLMSKVTSEEIRIPTEKLKRLGTNPNLLQVTKMKEVSPSQVLLMVPEADYGVDRISVTIPAS